MNKNLSTTRISRKYDNIVSKTYAVFYYSEGCQKISLCELKTFYKKNTFLTHKTSHKKGYSESHEHIC